MPKGIMVVQSGPADASREDEYNDWYSNTHIPQILEIPGFVGARRYRLHGDAPVLPYLAVYEIDADDVTAPVAELRARSASGQMSRSDVLGTEPAPVVALYELLE